MHHILIYTEVKHQSFYELAKAIERKRQKKQLPVGPRTPVPKGEFGKFQFSNGISTRKLELLGAHFPSGL